MIYIIDREREICAQIGLGDAIMMYKDSQNRVEVHVWVVGGGLPEIWQPERRGGLLVVITQRWKVNKTMLRWWGGDECSAFGAYGSRGPYRRERVLTVGPWAP